MLTEDSHVEELVSNEVEDQDAPILRALVGTLGPDRVQSAPEILAAYQENNTEYRPRKILAVASPTSRDELVAIIRLANSYRTPIYPFSTGMNWGLGSKLPVVDDCILVNLAAMNRIIEVNETLAYAVIEPGVTQKQLCDYLEARRIPLMLNVTGSSANSSIVGNTLERGVGVLGQRTRDLRELEVVLGTGEIIRTGQQHHFGETRGPSYYSYGMGPDMLHLFTQSNLGVVSNITIDLAPKRNITVALIETPKAHVAEYIDKLAMLRRFDILSDGIELTTQNDPRLLGLDASYHFGSDSWLTWVKLWHRSPSLSAEVKDTIATELDGLIQSVHYFETGGEVPDAIKFRQNLGLGIPTNYTLDNMGRAFGVDAKNGNLDVDHHKNIPGFVCLLPAVPFHGQGVIDAVRVITEASQRLGCQPAITLSAIGKYAFEGFARVYFNRNDTQDVARAHEWSRVAQAELASIGVFPYRINVEDMVSFAKEDDPFWSLVKRFKQVCDPNGVIAPGRYCPL